MFKSFPWPQSPTLAQVETVASAAVSLRNLRRRIMKENDGDFRDLYRALELPGDNQLKNAQDELDAAVRSAYGMRKEDDPLTFLLALNGELAEREAKGRTVVSPGLPPIVDDPQCFITTDCVGMP